MVWVSQTLWALIIMWYMNHTERGFKLLVSKWQHLVVSERRHLGTLKLPPSKVLLTMSPLLC